jgi:hypothetical protein
LRRIGLLTSDFSLYHDLVRYLRDHGVPFESLAFGQPPGLQVGVVVTSWRDVLRPDLASGLPIVSVPVDAQGKEDVAAAVAQATRILEGVRGYREVVVGVDPGKRPGIALVGDGRLLHTAQVFALEEVARVVRGFLAQFPADRYVLRVGHGAPRERDEILRGLRGLVGPDVALEMVDETGSTPPPGRRMRLPADVAAAVAIARVQGRPAEIRPRRISAGQISDVQRESRELTEGRFTISRDLARQVAQGRLSLADAIEQEKSRPKSGRRKPS